MKIHDARDKFSGSNKLLRRARRLYVFLYCRGIRTHLQLSDAAKRMQDAGLYAEGAEKDVRFSILRKLWRISGHPDWHRWRQDSGWSFWKWKPWNRRDVRFENPPTQPDRIKIKAPQPA
jgi:hypothetical protein